MKNSGLLQILVPLLLLSTMAGSQSMSDIAQQEKNVQNPKPKHVITNDDLPSHPEASQSAEGQSPQVCNEDSARFTISNVATAEITYDATYVRGFSKDLNQLGPPSQGRPANAERAGLLPSDIAGLSQGGTKSSFIKAGYRFVYTAGPVTASGNITSYSIIAQPVRYGETGGLSFFGDQTGVFHATDQDRGATVTDPINYGPIRCASTQAQPGASGDKLAVDMAAAGTMNGVNPLSTFLKPVTEKERQERIESLQLIIDSTNDVLREECAGQLSDSKKENCDFFRKGLQDYKDMIDQLKKLGPLPN